VSHVLVQLVTESVSVGSYQPWYQLVASQSSKQNTTAFRRPAPGRDDCPLSCLVQTAKHM